MSVDGVYLIDCDAALAARVGSALGDDVAGRIHIDDGFTVVALMDEQIVGVVAVQRNTLPGPLTHVIEGFVDAIEVLGPHKRKGIAESLVDAALERAKGRHFFQLRAWIPEDRTDAIAMWMALGFSLAPAAISGAKGYFVSRPCTS